MKKKYVILVSLVLAFVLAAGCSNGSTSSAATPASSTAPAASSVSENPAFPTGTVTLICNYGAGGGTDLASRALASAMESVLGVPVSVVNKAGGSGTLGITEILNAKPDGYTFGVCSYAPMVIVPHQLEVAYNVDDFSYLGTISQYDYGVFVKADSSYQNIDDLVAAAKASGGMNMMGAGYPHPLVIEGLGKLTGVPFQWVNMQSSAEVVTGLMGGHVEAVSLVVGDAISYVESGELRMIASSIDTRLDAFPDVPTLKEQGYDIEIKSFLGLGLSKDVEPYKLEILRNAFEKAIEDPAYKTTMENLNMHMNYISGDDFASLLSTDYEFYKEYFANQAPAESSSK